MGWSAIAREMTSRGILSKAGTPIHPASVLKTFRQIEDYRSSGLIA
jgi:hypothetical protein